MIQVIENRQPAYTGCSVSRVVAFDPGQTTGFCEGYIDLIDGTFWVVKSATIAWDDRFEIGTLLAGTNPALRTEAVVIESFRLYQHRAKAQVGNDFPSSQVIGIIETFAWLQGLLDRVILQPASVITMVQVIDAHRPHIIASEHARDAYKHLRYYVITSRR